MGHPGLHCCHANASKHNGHLSQGPGKHIPPTHCPQTSPKKRAEWGECDTWTMCSSKHMFLNFLPVCQINSKAEGRLHVLEDFGPARWWCGGWFIYLLMTDLLEDLIECAAGKGIINKGLAVVQKSEFSWLMLLKRLGFFFPFCLPLVDIKWTAEIDPRSEIPEGLVKVVYASGDCLTTFL